MTAALSGGPPAGTISPFVENSVRVFRCPDAADRTPGSPTQGQHFQISYAINPDVGGKRIGEVRGVLVFEHDDLPSCRGAGEHFTEWLADADTKAQRHDPKRHFGKSNNFFYSGNVPYGD